MEEETRQPRREAAGIQDICPKGMVAQKGYVMVENAHFTSVYRNNELGMGVIIRSVRKVVIIRPQSIIGGMVRNEI